MKAVVQQKYGSPDVLRIADVDEPVIGDDDVLVRVVAAGVDQGVWHLVAGEPRLIRLAGFGVRRPKNPVPGMDVAGRVTAVGANVTRFRPGDEVFGSGKGTYAEYAAVPAKRLVHKPANVSFEEAAAVPISALAALQGLRKAKVRTGQRVLVLGASGGVGSFTVQLARSSGAHVTGVSSTAKTDLVRSLGAEEVLDYTRDDVTDGSRRYDVVLDIGGSRPLSALRRALQPDGTLVIMGGEGGPRWGMGIERQVQALLLSPFTKQTLGSLLSLPKPEDLQQLADLLAAGTIRAVVDRTFPLAEAGAAINYLRAGKAKGKVVLTV
jgi:NADPH:quinone reductase-like Zn-dependent oxidoreductase